MDLIFIGKIDANIKIIIEDKIIKISIKIKVKILSDKIRNILTRI